MPAIDTPTSATIAETAPPRHPDLVKLPADELGSWRDTVRRAHELGARFVARHGNEVRIDFGPTDLVVVPVDDRRAAEAELDRRTCAVLVALGPHSIFT